jgi:hypothetical protein
VIDTGGGLLTQAATVFSYRSLLCGFSWKRLFW